jgi:outer membrane protein assembly factor BamB
MRAVLALLTASLLPAQVAVLSNRYDRQTTGANTAERLLTPAAVGGGKFGKLYSYYVDGAVYAQPLYVAGVDGRNVVYIATANDKVYAFDADRSGPPLWMRDLTNEMAGVTPFAVPDITGGRNDLNVVGNAGIIGTPVIDDARKAMFLVARTREKNEYVQRLHKLDITTGADVAPAVVIEASAPGSTVKFDARANNQRPALVIVRGHVIIAWASHEDIQPYHGWVLAYDAATLKQTGAFCVTPDGPMGGIWQSGRGPAVDDDGNIYFETGNGHFDGKRNFGNSVLKLAIGRDGMTLQDFYTPHDWEALNARDVDLGSTGPMLIPGTSLLLCGNKKGVLFLLDTHSLGKITADDKGILQAVEVNGGRDLAGPAFWNGNVYIWTEADVLKAFRFDGKLLGGTPVAKGTVASKGSPGGALTVSADGAKSGTGIVWAMLTVNRSADHGNAPGALRAFHAETLEELWSSEAQAKRDRLGTLVKFVPPLVAGGKVYAPNYDNAVVVYGLLP